MHWITTCLLMASTVTCFAQQGGGGGAGGGAGGGGNGGNGQFPGGIIINPSGVIGSPEAQRINPKLLQQKMKVLAQQNLPSDMASSSDLRKVSLVRMEAICKEALKDGAAIPDRVRYLGGITQIQYLIAVPETGDLLIAGPAEGFARLPDGRMVGVETGRPVLTLDDLLVMLRLPDINTSLGCSFDPEPERLANAQAWNNANNAPASVAVARQRFVQMSQVLGNWDIRIFGIPQSSHAAITAVEADYQLKRLTLGCLSLGFGAS